MPPLFWVTTPFFKGQKETPGTGERVKRALEDQFALQLRLLLEIKCSKPRNEARGMSRRHRDPRGTGPKRLWVKNTYSKMNPGKWNQGHSTTWPPSPFGGPDLFWVPWFICRKVQGFILGCSTQGLCIPSTRAKGFNSYPPKDP